MQFRDDGDIIRAYGFVAIRFATLEEVIDDRLRQASPLLPQNVRLKLDRIISRIPFSERVNILKDMFDNLSLKQSKNVDLWDRERSLRILEACLQAAIDRNDTLHSAIVADSRTGETVRNSRRNGQRVVTSSEVYDLAQRLDNLDSCVYSLAFVINSLLAIPRLTMP